MNRPLDATVELHENLTRLSEARERLSGIPDWMRELHEEHSLAKAEIEALELVVEQAGQERRTAEAAVEDAQEKLRRFQEQISLVRTQREYGALLQEIDTVKAQIKESEEQALEAMERQEEARERTAEKREAFRDLDARYAAELVKWEQEKPAVELEIRQLQTTIEVLRERLPPAILGQFERLHDRHAGKALAPVLETQRGARGPKMWHCGACNYRVRPQAVVEIRNGRSLILCESCKRILYLQGAAA